MTARLLSAAALAGALCLAPAAAGADETPKRGGTLTYMIPADAPPTLDGHRETTFATLHAAAPFYSVLIRVNPNNPASPTDLVCDLCIEIPQPTDAAKQRALMRQFEKRVLDTEAHQMMVTYWNRIIPLRSYVKGWKISPSHYINQDLANVWRDK